VVKEAWDRPVQVTNPFLRLHIKLQRTSKKLRVWARGLIGNNKVLLCAAQKLIAVLDVVQEFMPLSVAKVSLRRDLKARLLGLTVVEKLRVRQASRLTSIRASEANEKLLFLQANGRRRKNSIHSLEMPEGICYSHKAKEAVLFQHFSSQFSQPAEREFTLNWEEVGLQRHDLAHL
jgi:hypothetical protein